MNCKLCNANVQTYQTQDGYICLDCIDAAAKSAQFWFTSGMVAWIVISGILFATAL